ncbi:MAG: transglycosylase family protein, partial [Thermoleophilia bacterium]|nr:transglycosylase family protein [Thermoleophilia bacterium]
ARRAATPPPPPPPSGGIRVSPRAGTVPGGPSAATLARIADCESDGNPRAVSSNGLYRGKYQFLPSTWASVGGSGDPAAAPEAEQDYRAALLFVRDGPGQWPVCAAFVPR